MGFIKKNSVFLAIAIVSCIVDIFSKYVVFDSFDAVIVMEKGQVKQEYEPGPDGRTLPKYRYLDHDRSVVVPWSYAPYPVVPHFFNLSVVLNRGAVWGSFHGRVGLLTIFSVLAIAFIFYLLWKTPYLVSYQIALALIMGGAAGNLWDRLWFAGVRDFLDFYVAGRHWPTFNLADVYIVVGIALYILLEFREGKKKKP